MGCKEIFICDVCGAERQGTNHWFIGSTSSPTSSPTSSSYTTSVLILFRFNHKDARNAIYSVLCGEACVSKWVSSRLTWLHAESV